MDGDQQVRAANPAKRQAILDAALAVFAQLGYVRTSIEAIATQADVSTRTIYNHFQNKADLFQNVIEQSAAHVAEAQIKIVDEHLGDLDGQAQELEALLVAFATAWTQPIKRYAQHRALVEQIRAEVGHIPQSALNAWQAAGPLQVRHALAQAFARLAEDGMLTTSDPEIAAGHFTRLVTLDDPLRPGRRITRKQADTIIANGVHTFLYGYAG